MVWSLIEEHLLSVSFISSILQSGVLFPRYALHATCATVSGIGAVVEVVDSHRCGWGSIPNKSCSFFITSLSKDLSQYFICSDQHVKYWMPRGFPMTSSLILDYHVNQW